jgi:hypothetical protein
VTPGVIVISGEVTETVAVPPLTSFDGEACGATEFADGLLLPPFPPPPLFEAACEAGEFIEGVLAASPGAGRVELTDAPFTPLSECAPLQNVSVGPDRFIRLVF